MEVLCSKISNFQCDEVFQIHGGGSGEAIIVFLDHYNVAHDPGFVPRCKDDLVVEYQWIVQKLQELLLKDSFKFRCYQADF